MDTYKISEMVKEVKPIWKNFILDLGYSQEQAEKFVEGYEGHLANLPLIEKMKAVSTQYDPCMEAGFKNAGIEEEEALARYQK